MSSPDTWLSLVLSGYLHEEVVFDYDQAREGFLQNLKMNDPPFQLLVIDRLLEIFSDVNLTTAKAKEWGVYVAEDYEDPQPGFDEVFAPLIAPLEALKLELERSLNGSS